MWAQNYGKVLQILILKYSSGPEKLAGLSSNGPQVPNVCLRVRLLFYPRNLEPRRSHMTNILANVRYVSW